MPSSLDSSTSCIIRANIRNHQAALNFVVFFPKLVKYSMAVAFRANMVSNHMYM